MMEAKGTKYKVDELEWLEFQKPKTKNKPNFRLMHPATQRYQWGHWAFVKPALVKYTMSTVN